MNNHYNCFVEEEIFSHEYLWRSSSKLAELSSENNGQNSYHFSLPCLLISFMAFEAFVNFLGYILEPEVWNDEKKHFKGKGIEGKLDFIVKLFPEFVWEKGQNPYQKIKYLETFRNMIAHGKVINKDYTTRSQEDGSHFKLRPDWESYIKKSEIYKFRRCIKIFSQSLLDEARKISNHPHLLFKAYEGCLSNGESRSI